jgi:four helix bundle protein
MVSWTLEEGGKKVEVSQARRPIQGFRDLEVYQRGMALLQPVHELVLRFPDYERFDLANQMRRAAKSIPTNIAEGYGRRASPKSFKLFLSMALGSANEMEVHFEVARTLGHVRNDECAHFIAEYQIIARQLRTLIDRWRPRPPSSVLPPLSTIGGKD